MPLHNPFFKSYLARESAERMTDVEPLKTCKEALGFRGLGFRGIGFRVQSTLDREIRRACTRKRQRRDRKHKKPETPWRFNVGEFMSSTRRLRCLGCSP